MLAGLILFPISVVVSVDLSSIILTSSSEVDGVSCGGTRGSGGWGWGSNVLKGVLKGLLKLDAELKGLVTCGAENQDSRYCILAKLV